MTLNTSSSKLIQKNSNEKLKPMFDTLEAESHENFVNALKLNLEKIVLSLEKEGEQFYTLKEEQLNSAVASSLRQCSYTVDTESSHRGKVDLTVRHDGFEWLIEAKIGHDNNYIFEGLLQLTTRYLTNQSSSGMLVYFKNDRPNIRFEEWCSYINNNEWIEYAKKKGIDDPCTYFFSDSNCTDIDSPTKKRASTDVTLSSGNRTNIEFFGVNLYFNPLDKSGRSGQAKRLFHAKQHLLQAYCAHKQGGNFGSVDELFKSLDVIFELEKDLKSLLENDLKKVKASKNK